MLRGVPENGLIGCPGAAHMPHTNKGCHSALQQGNFERNDLSGFPCSVPNTKLTEQIFARSTISDEGPKRERPLGNCEVSADSYLQDILDREAVDTGVYSPVWNVYSQLAPVIREWAGNRLVSINPSGSFAKGTANHSGTDIDLFISLSTETSETLREIYNKLFNWMSTKGYAPKHQNVSIQVSTTGYKVDLVPAKRQNSYNDDHSLYRRRADTWTKTNVTTHINYVTRFRRMGEIRIVKLWRDQKRLDLPSFYLELTVINALSGEYGTLSANVWKCFKYFRDNFTLSRVIDPANTNNCVSDELTVVEKAKIKAAAALTLGAKDWSQIVR